MSVDDKLKQVREWMTRENLDALVVPTDDPHGSEYLAEHWQCRKWLTGFTGSAGTAVVTQKEALLWTDSRYWLQAEEQLSGTEFRLMKDGEDVDISDWLSSHCENVRWSYNAPFDEIWKDRPSLPATKAWVMPEDVVGESAESKLNRLVEYLRVNNQKGIYVSDLSEVAWLLNVRASDIDYNPYVIAFLYVSADGKHRMYVNKEQVEDIKDYLSALNISVEPYDEDITRFCDKTPITEWKSRKNLVEQDGFRKAHLCDGVAMVQFLVRLQDALAKGECVSELWVDKELTALRAKQAGYLSLSFETIAGFGAHGAIVHYEATEETNAALDTRGLLLLDSGAHYLNGTTDITRTIAIGEPTAEEKRVYTLVLKGHLCLQNMHFPDGTTGLQLDTAARMSMWREGYDFGHGTGHGVGHVLGVHEGPVQIRKNHRGDTVLPIKVGQVITDEPGIYVAGRFGVRIENCLLCIEDRQTEYGKFLKFEPLTLCPYDSSLIDVAMLTEEERTWLNAYHAMVCEKLLPLLSNDDEKAWLIRATAKL
jgi:Xaa-Pro aminopeptidase